MDRYAQNFRKANIETRLHFWKAYKRTGLLTLLAKTLSQCYDKLAAKQGNRFTVAPTNTAGSITHFKSIDDVDQYLMDCAVVRSWAE